MEKEKDRVVLPAWSGGFHQVFAFGAQRAHDVEVFLLPSRHRHSLSQKIAPTLPLSSFR